jgi:DNA-binding response OmpR family regulator
MSASKSPPRTILHFGSDQTTLIFRGWFLNSAGYRVINTGNGFDTIGMSTCKQVDAVLLDLDRNRAEVTVIAREIKRHRPELPTLLLTDKQAQVNGLQQLVDALVPKASGPETLVKSLKILLPPHTATRVV